MGFWLLVENAAHPVTVSLPLDGVLALGKGVPQLDGLVPGPGNYLTIVSGERNRHDVLGVVFEPEHGESEQVIITVVVILNNTYGRPRS